MKRWIEEHFSDNERAMRTICVMCWWAMGLAVAIFVFALLFVR